MKNILSFTLFLFIHIQGCSYPERLQFNRKVIYSQVDGYVIFRTGNYRIWLMNYSRHNDSCKSRSIFIFLCRTGLLTGRAFYDGFIDNDNSFSASIIIKANTYVDDSLGFNNYQVLPDDTSSNFKGQTAWVEDVWFKSINKGKQLDTLIIDLSVDPTGKLPGPMSIFTLKVTCLKQSMPCSGLLINPQVIKVLNEGMIL